MRFFLPCLLAVLCLGADPVQLSAPSPRLRTCTASANPLFHVYDELLLEDNGLSRVAYELALQGMRYVPKPKPILLVADMSLPSTRKRLFVIDLAKRKLLFNTYVAHGQGSGTLRPNRFSNAESSMQSSLGFYRAMGRYWGKHGLSMKLQGLEKGINDRVFARNIVLHGADYVSEDTIRYTGMLGRSQGCPAVPNKLCTPIIEAVEGGATLFIYYPDKHYLAQSTFVKPGPGLVASP